MRRSALLLASLLLAAAARAHPPNEIRVYGTGGQSYKTWHGQSDVQALNIELGRAVRPNYDVAFVFAPMNFRQPRSWFGDLYGDGSENVRAISGSLLVRRRWNLDSSRVEYDVEGSSGPIWAEKAVPASTSRFNFVSQFGVGVTLMPRSHFPIIAGYRFMHVSNGGYSPRNPGLNFSSIFLGVRVR